MNIAPENILSQYPELIALALILGGFLLAGFLSRGIIKLLTRSNGWARLTLPSMTLISSNAENIVQKVVYYVTMGVSILVALRLLGLGGLTDILDVIIVFVPGAISGASIILVGYLISLFVYHMLLGAAWSSGNELLSRTAQGAILTVAILTGLTQMSVDVSLIGQTMIVVLLVTLSGMALAFGLGSVTYVRNILASRIFPEYSIGDRIQFDKVEGSIVNFRRTHVVIQTDQGLAIIPSHLFAEAIVTRLTSS
ncbi:MAG: hypothetical protein ACI82A_001440 [Candidatus Azotimanducaceae bacterium]|jgi:hypothetical protein